MIEEKFVDQTVELCQQLIKNKCLNYGTLESGNEIISAKTLKDYLSPVCDQVQIFEPFPTRGSIVAKISGFNKNAPKLVLCGHTDVVPVNEKMWDYDPFAGEIVDGYLWGRGAIDMLNLTSSMAVAFKQLCEEGFKPNGDIIFFGVADEEAGGKYGAQWLLDNETEHVDADYCITEAGGFHDFHKDKEKILRAVSVSEKGPNWFIVKVKGQPGHASQPYNSDNALTKAATLINSISEYEYPVVITQEWKKFVNSSSLTSGIESKLTNIDHVHDTIEKLPTYIQPLAHACTHATITPTMIKGGVKENVIPDEVEFRVDVRTLPSQEKNYSLELLQKIITKALGTMDDVELVPISQNSPSISTVDTPLYDVMTEITKKISPRSELVPTMFSGGTDGRFYRYNGNIAYGYGLFSEKISYKEYSQMFHGHNEKVDIQSLKLSTMLYYEIIKKFMKE